MLSRLLLKKSYALQFGAAYSVIFISRAYAQTPGGTVDTGGSVTIDSPFSGTIIDVLQRITNFLILIGAPIATIMVLYGAFQMLTAGANAEQFRKGTQTILYAAIGYGIVLIGSGIISIVKQLITG